VLSLFTVGYFCTVLSTRLSRNIYESKKTSLERILKRNLNKNFDLGEFSDLRFLGFSVLKTKIVDIEIPDSRIEAENMYVRFMPIRSFLNREWVFSLNPNKLKVDIREDFFLRRRKIINLSKRIKRRFNYEVHLNLKNNSILNINNFGIKGNIRGNLIYRSSRNQLITFLNANLKEKGNLKLKINRKFSNQFLSLILKTNDLNLKDVKYKLINEELKFNDGSIKSNFKFIKAQDKNYCNGNISITNFNLFTNKLNENINSKLFNLNCNDNKLSIEGNQLNYGTLTSNLDLDVPLNNVQNNISFKGDIGFKKNPNPVITYEGDIPYWYNNKGFNFGNLSSNINLNRTKLDNLNIFRNNGISGFITAKGKLSGNLNNINTLINFNIEYPTYKGVRIKETFDGKIENKQNGYLLKLTPRESVIPTFLSINFDQNFKLDKLNLSRTLYPDTGNLNIFKNNNNYQWRADKFNLKKLELSILDNDYEWVEGEINGSGFISSDLTNFDGSISLKDGKYRNISFTESNIKFEQNGDSLNLETLLKTNDGGEIEIIYKSDEYDFIKAKLNNVSSSWTAITAFDLIDFKKNNLKPQKNYGSFIDLEIKNNLKTLDERIKFLNNFIKQKKVSNRKKRLNNFIDKFDSRYSGEINLSGTDSSNYAIKAKIDGNLIEKNNFKNNFNNNFSAFLTGGLLKNKGKLVIETLPLSFLNLFFNESKNFKGDLSFDLDYDLNKKSFGSIVSSENASINDFSVTFNKGSISLLDSKLNIDLALLLNKSGNPITFLGSIPLQKNKELDLRLRADEKVFDLLENLYGKNFAFKNGDIDLRMKFSGVLNKPEANGYLNIDNGAFDIYRNSLQDINALFIFDFDKLEIVNFKAKGLKSGNIDIKGSLPFYKAVGNEESSMKFISNDFNLIDGNINFFFDGNISFEGSFLYPIIGGDIGLKNGYLDLKSNQNKNIRNLVKKNNDLTFEIWPELNWNKKKDIEIISNESILNKNLFDKNLPLILSNIKFNNLKLKLGPEFRIEYGNILEAYLETKSDIYINGNFKNDLKARGLILIKKGKANLYTTPFKLDKNNFNHILFASRNALNPYLDFALTSKVPDSIIPISENKKDINISEDNQFLENNNSFGSFGIGNTRSIKIDASYKGFLDQLSFEDQNQKIKLRSTPSYSRSQIIGLIGGNSANIINRAFASQLSGSNGFNERFQLSIYPALIENNQSFNNIFSNENIDINEANDEDSANNDLSSQTWIAELGLDITDSLNFAIQTTPDREDIPPLWILTLQANQYLELLGSFDSNGDWKSQLQLFFRY
tara:strand:- start:370 stop:4278 length:3909 start_codon:yes stop_codon:yes gene_type:complete